MKPRGCIWIRIGRIGKRLHRSLDIQELDQCDLAALLAAHPKEPMNSLFATINSLAVQGASSIHIVAGKSVIFRNGGRLRRLTPIIGSDQIDKLFDRVASTEDQAKFKNCGSADFDRLLGRLSKFRFSVFKQRGQTAMVIRAKLDPIESDSHYR